MHFELTQHYSAPIDDVAAAFCDPALYEEMATLPVVGMPEVLRRDDLGDRVRLAVRYRFTGELTPDARAVVDPTKLVWVEVSMHELPHHHVTYSLTPDHYADRFSCAGANWFVRESRHRERTVRHCIGNIHVKVPLVSTAIERALVAGLRDRLEAEAPVVERFLASQHAPQR